MHNIDVEMKRLIGEVVIVRDGVLTTLREAAMEYMDDITRALPPQLLDENGMQMNKVHPDEIANAMIYTENISDDVKEPSEVEIYVDPTEDQVVTDARRYAVNLVEGDVMLRTYQYLRNPERLSILLAKLNVKAQ